MNEAIAETSRFEDYIEVVGNWRPMYYACDNVSGDYKLAPLDTYTPGDMRAPGAAPGMTRSNWRSTSWRTPRRWIRSRCAC